MTLTPWLLSLRTSGLVCTRFSTARLPRYLSSVGGAPENCDHSGLICPGFTSLTNSTSAGTAEGYRIIIHRHLTPNFGAIPLAQLQPSHIQSYYAKAINNDGVCENREALSARTVTNIHKVLSEALNHAVKWQILIRNVALAVDPPRPTQQQMSTFAEEQAGRFLKSAPQSPHHELFVTALLTGLRRSELLGLSWKNVDLDMAQLSVNQTLHRLSGVGFVFTKPKTTKSRRTVALPPLLCVLLRRLKERQTGTRLLLGQQAQDDELVFSRPDGEPLDPSTVTHAFRKVTRAAGLPDLRFHDLRHTHASLMLKQGVHPKIVSGRPGHSGIGITLDTYSHVLPGLQEAAALGLEEALQRTTSGTLANG